MWRHARLARGEERKAQFLAREPAPEPSVAPCWATYQQVLSAEGLLTSDPQDLKDFANSHGGAYRGIMSMFNVAWKQMGAEAGAGSAGPSAASSLWSNDLPLALLGDGFEHQQHAAAFLGWARDTA